MIASVSHLRRAANERGFSLIEVIIAMTILSIVLSGAAMAVVSSDSAERRTKAVADSHAIAEKAAEQLRSDLTLQTHCDNGGWIAAARAAKQSAGTTAANFAPCLLSYTAADGMVDSKGRQYAVSMVVQAKDKTEDGFGRADSDGDLRDTYDVEITVRLANNSRAGRENAPDVKVAATVDWNGGSTDDARITVIACAIDRPDRSLLAGGCNAGDASRTPVTVQLSAALISEESGGSSAAGTITSGNTPTNLRPGAYRFTAPAALNASGGSFTLFKLDPADLRVAGSQNYTIQATYVRNSMTTRVCTQINNWKQPFDDGYEVLTTNLHYRRSNNPGMRSSQLTLNDNRSWNCTAAGHVLYDPIQSIPQNLYRGLYDIEVEQVNREIPVAYAGLTVTGASMNCSLAAYDKPMGGSSLISRPLDNINERTAPGSGLTVFNRASWLARMPINAAAGAQTLCLRFYSRQFERERCLPPNERAPGCFFVGTDCALPAGVVDNDTNCWNGADGCIANCAAGGGPPAGTVGPTMWSTQAGGISGGPNDGTVGCMPEPVGYTWPGTRDYGYGNGTDVPMATTLAHTWTGGSGTYYANFNGTAAAFKAHPWGVAPNAVAMGYPDHPVFHCMDSYFSVTPDLAQSKYPFYTCLEVQYPGRPEKIRGLVLDTSGGTDTLYLTVGAALGLVPEVGRHSKFWNPYTNSVDGFTDILGGPGSGWPNLKVQKVDGDPVCNTGAGPVWGHVDPMIVDIYHRVVDDPDVNPLAPPPSTTNLTTDKVGV